LENLNKEHENTITGLEEDIVQLLKVGLLCNAMFPLNQDLIVNCHLSIIKSLLPLLVVNVGAYLAWECRYWVSENTGIGLVGIPVSG